MREMQRRCAPQRCALVILTAFMGTLATVHAQSPSDPPENTLSGGNQNQHDPAHQQHFFGDWGGRRPELLDRGVNFDFQYESDLLWNVRSPRSTRSTDFTRGRATIDIDFAKLTGRSPHQGRLLIIKAACDGASKESINGHKRFRV